MTQSVFGFFRKLELSGLYTERGLTFKESDKNSGLLMYSCTLNM